MKIRASARSIALALLFAAVAWPAHTEGPPSEKVKPYPLKTCLVCDMNLGEMGKPYVFVYKNQEIQVCNKSEKADFDKDPAKYLKKLKAAEAELKKQPPPKP